MLGLDHIILTDYLHMQQIYKTSVQTLVYGAKWEPVRKFQDLLEILEIEPNFWDNFLLLLVIGDESLVFKFNLG